MTLSDKARPRQRLPQCRLAITASGGVGSGMKPPCVCLAGENRFVMRFDVSDHLVSSRTLLPPIMKLIGQLLSHIWIINAQIR